MCKLCHPFKAYALIKNGKKLTDRQLTITIKKKRYYFQRDWRNITKFIISRTRCVCKNRSYQKGFSNAETKTNNYYVYRHNHIITKKLNKIS